MEDLSEIESEEEEYCEPDEERLDRIYKLYTFKLVSNWTFTLSFTFK